MTDDQALAERTYEPPSLIMHGSVLELTGLKVLGGSDALFPQFPIGVIGGFS